MLILSRRVNERILIGDAIEIFVVDIKGDQVKIGFKAPREVKVYRPEVLQEIQQQNIEAARAAPEELPEIGGLLRGKPEEPEGPRE
jgi:carbon storage regulator